MGWNGVVTITAVDFKGVCGLDGCDVVRISDKDVSGLTPVWSLRVR